MHRMLQGLMAAALLAGALPATAAPRGFLRISSSSPTRLTGWEADGTLVWSNASPGSTGRIQCADSLPAAATDWTDLLFFTATGMVMSAALPAECAPTGMVLIPAGPFMMGNATNVFSWEEGFSDELPQHSVYVSGFFLDRNHVTKAFWDEVRSWGSSRGYTDLPVGSWYNGTNYSKGPTHPVHLVNWFDCVKWCNARSERDDLAPVYYIDAGFTTVYRTGVFATNSPGPYADWSANGYRLPTEAEWEKAARGGTANRRFPWSDSNEIQHERANYYSRTNEVYDTSSTRGDHPLYATGSIPYTSPVGSFPPNGYGIYDMAGNVWDWCWDWYSGTYYSASPATDPRGPVFSLSRILRGGAWWRTAFQARVAYRGINAPASMADFIGFRCARGL